MALSDTVADIVTQVDRHLGDAGTLAVSAADRADAITQATVEMMNEGIFPDFFTSTFVLSYFDTLNYYDLMSSSAPDFMHASDVRVEDEQNHILPFAYKSPNELALEINSFEEDAFTIERRDRLTYLGIVHNSKYTARVVNDCDSLTTPGTWAADNTNSDAENLTLDGNEFKEGDGSLNFDVDVSDSANNRATLENTGATAIDMTDDEDLSSFLMWVYLPDVDLTDDGTLEFTSVTFYWGSDSSNYWSRVETVDAFGATFKDGWNRMKFDWPDATKTGTPAVAAIDYFRVDFNYAAGQTDDTDFRLDDIIIVRPEKLKFFYQTWAIGVTSASDSTKVYDFASTNVPWWDGIYDYLSIYVALRAAGILFEQIRDFPKAAEKNAQATKELEKIKRKFPSRRKKEVKNFKAHGLSWLKINPKTLRRRMIN